MHPNLTLEPSSKPDELIGGPQVQTETVRNLDLATGDCRLVSSFPGERSRFRMRDRTRIPNWIVAFCL